MLGLLAFSSGVRRNGTGGADCRTEESSGGGKEPAVHDISGSGVITSVDATHLMITHKVNGKDAPMTLVLTPETKREGTMAAGNKVAVRYHMENNDMVATSVRATACNDGQGEDHHRGEAKKS